MATLDIAATFPPKLKPLFKPRRYKIVYGGRGGAKSWSFARALLILGKLKPLRILCAREFMASIRDSVHMLLCDQIVELGLSDFYDIEQRSIIGKNGTTFTFAGLKSNVSQIKSYEGIDIVWVEEADNVSAGSWRTLRPTIRKKGSEIWLSFNPKFSDDPTYKLFIVQPPDDAFICKMDFRDNPWFPDTLLEELEQLKANNYEEYLHVYEGECVRFIEGAIYLNELRQAEDDGRICNVPYDATAAVQVFLDIGYADATAMWFAQKVGFETHVIDYYENTRQPLDHYLKHIADKPYPVNHIWLPHDARAKQLGTGRSVEELVRAKGHHVSIVPNLSIADGINALRTTFPTMYFDAQRCADGLQALRHYRFEVVGNGDDQDQDTPFAKAGFKNLPVHNRWSHGADAARYLAIALKPPKAKSLSKYRDYRRTHIGADTSWMAL